MDGINDAKDDDDDNDGIDDDGWSELEIFLKLFPVKIFQTTKMMTAMVPQMNMKIRTVME